MKKFVSFLLVFVIISSLFSMSAFAENAADSTSHEHSYIYEELVSAPTEAYPGILRYWCSCYDYVDVELAPLPPVYVSEYRDNEAALCSRIIVTQNGGLSGSSMSATMADWNATLLSEQYDKLEDNSHLKYIAVEFKVKSIGIGTFDSKIGSYTLNIPVSAITDCVADGSLPVYLTTGAAMVYLPADATAAAVKQADKSFGVTVTRDGEKVKVDFLVDGKSAAAPSGTEMLYWVKDAGDEAASDAVLGSREYIDFPSRGDYGLIHSTL